MHSIQLLYGNASQTLRFEIPTSWTSIPTVVNIQVEDNAGTEVLVSTAATIGFTADTLNGATAIGATTAILTTGATLVRGDRVYIAASAAGRDERATVSFYDSTTKTITFSRALEYAHSSTAAVSALWFKYTYDISTTATYSLGKDLTINWVPNNNEPVVSQRAEIVKFDYELQDLEKEFHQLYPQEHQMIETEFPTFERTATNRIKRKLQSKQFDLDKVRDPEIFRDVTIELICYLANKSSSADSRKTEMDSALKEYNLLMKELEHSFIWFDADQDDIVDDDEDRPIFRPPPSRGY